MQFYNFLKLFIAFNFILLSACTTQYIADADPDQLVAAMQDLPKAQPYLAKVNFYPVANLKTGKAKANNADTRNLNAIIYPEKEMLNQAGHASIFRWFNSDGQTKNDKKVPVLNMHARIFKLDHSLKVEKGNMRPVTKTKLEVYLTDSKENRIYESVFTTYAEGDLIKRFRNKRETQDMYGYTIYKGLVLAFESACADITNTLNLKPTNFDVDALNLENDSKEVKELSSAM